VISMSRSSRLYTTHDATEIAIIERIDWCNAVRLHGEIGDVPPAEHEADWYRHNPAARDGRHHLIRG
jgi:transposase InsO family protein